MTRTRFCVLRHGCAFGTGRLSDDDKRTKRRNIQLNECWKFIEQTVENDLLNSFRLRFSNTNDFFDNDLSNNDTNYSHWNEIHSFFISLLFSRFQSILRFLQHQKRRLRMSFIRTKMKESSTTLKILPRTNFLIKILTSLKTQR